MNATEAQTGFRPVQEGTTIKTSLGGALTESLGALATIALGIIGLTAGGMAVTMAAIATIILGAAVWIEGGAFALTRAGRTQPLSAETRFLRWTEGFGAEFLGGIGAMVLGILALLGVAPDSLLSIAALALGGTFLLSSAAGFGAGSQPMFGLAGLVLGLLAVVGLDRMVLVLAALICLGAAALFNGAVRGARMAEANRL